MSTADRIARPSSDSPLVEPGPAGLFGEAQEVGITAVASSERPPRLLHAFSNFVPAGPEIRTVALIGAMGDEFRHTILSMDGRMGAAQRLPAGAPVRLLPSPPRAGSVRTTLRLRRILRRERPDLVLTYNWGAFDMLLAAGTLHRHPPVIHHEDGFNTDEARRFKLRRIWARRVVLRRVAHRVVVPSQSLEKIALRRWRLPAEQVCLIPNGIRLDSFAPADRNPSIRERLGIPRDRPLVGTVGHLRTEKNLSRLLEAWALLRRRWSCHLLIVGDGPERGTLEVRAHELAGAAAVHFAGHQDDPAPFYRAMDVFAMSSDTEQMPVALLEAMASQLPVAATAVGDLPTILPQEQMEYLVPVPESDTAAQLAVRIERLFADPPLARRLGAVNRATVEQRHSFAAMCGAYRALYRSALTSPRCQP